MEPMLLLAFVALGLMAVVPIYIGAHFAVKTFHAAQRGDQEVEHIDSNDAKRFPIMGSAVLFGLYLLYRYVKKEYFQYFLTGVIALSGASAMSNFLHDAVLHVSPFLQARLGEPYALILQEGKKVAFETNFDKLHIVTFVLASAFAAYYEVTKDWIANNVIGLCLAVSAMQVMLLDRFQTGIIMLSGLFFYDIFWVFGTEVMVTVARSFDAPIKIVFPRDLFAAEYKHTMLGLGDIVVPGVFIALALCFDESRAKGRKSYPTPYFNACMTAYVIGLITTVTVMQVFQAAQPALLYLSPACILAVVITALLRNEWNEVFSFTTKPPAAATNGAASSSSVSTTTTPASSVDDSSSANLTHAKQH